MHIPKANHGGAYIMILTAIMLILMLVTVALGVTATSRRITARYIYNAGLYDLAVSGNEQALFLLQQRFDSQKEIITNQAWTAIVNGPPVNFVFSDNKLRLDTYANERFGEIFAEIAMSDLSSYIRSRFSREYISNRGFVYRHTWELNTVIDTDRYTITNFFRGTVTLQPYNHHIYSRVENHLGQGRTSPSATVRTTINWLASGYREIALDAHTIDIFEINGSTFPVIPFPGMIIFLDEFTLAMVESLRIAN